MMKLKYQFITRSGGYYWWVANDPVDGGMSLVSCKVSEFWVDSHPVPKGLDRMEKMSRARENLRKAQQLLDACDALKREMGE